MSRIYASPLRVYLCLAALAAVGIHSALKLPVSLFPNSSRPEVGVHLSYGTSTADEFMESFGGDLEGQLRGIQVDDIEVEKLEASYNRHGVNFRVKFKWGAPAKEALKEVERTVHAFASRLPTEVRDSVGVWSNNQNSGFLAVSFYSQTRSLDSVYDVLDPVIGSQIAKVQDADEAVLFNPTRKEVRIELRPETMATLQLMPGDVSRAIQGSLSGQGAGTVRVGDAYLAVQMPRQVNSVEDLAQVLIQTPSGKTVHLRDVARIDFGPVSGSGRSFKTSGAPSIILWASPRAGGNVKRMSEEILAVVQREMPNLPKDIQYRVLVDPSEFIRAAVNNVFHEVAIGAFLAVCILFVFIGSFRNVVTAAIEIPLSMILAFILMRVAGMNLNLISLGGLALSAGMNVDASVVVLENIFRHFGELPAGAKLDFKKRLEVISRAVAEVRFAVIASTIASLVVFLPLAFTSDLSNAILGDLAKTVVFSHGLSMIVALILVPTVRLHLMNSGKGGSAHPESPVESWIVRMEQAYASGLKRFIDSPKLKWGTYGGLLALLVVLGFFVLPRLPKEIIGRPDTDWMYMSVSTPGNKLSKQMESQADLVEDQMMKKFGQRIQYTFVQIQGPNHASVMARLKDKKDMNVIWKDLEAEFTNTPLQSFYVFPWNPAEMPIPDPEQMRIAIRGGTVEERAEVTEKIKSLLVEKDTFNNMWSKPEVSPQDNVIFRPYVGNWPALRTGGASFMPGDLADLTRVITEGRRVGSMALQGKTTDIQMGYPENTVQSVEDLAAFPIGVGSKLVPLKALTHISVEKVPPTIYREDQRSVFLVYGKKKEGEEIDTAARLKKAQELVAEWRAGEGKKYPQTTITFEDSEKELNDALKQLAIAVALSVLLILGTLVIQFGGFVNALLVLVSIPLGFIGVLVSLFVFKSTLSLNSILGVILLNGISVANSIILVDFLKRLVDQGVEPGQAAIEAGRKRLRPILITSMTTILGMLPIALGFGEGGRILQPLGIAVSGGLWVSMALTLFIVPALQVSYLRRRSRPSIETQVLGEASPGAMYVDPAPQAEGRPSPQNERWTDLANQLSRPVEQLTLMPDHLQPEPEQYQ